MRISIGILAHNEASRIAPTIRSLCEQTLLAQGRPDIEAVEVLCLANGCTDATARVAAQEFARSSRILGNDRLEFRVVEIEIGDRANCWNVFIGEASDRAADYLIQLDADIEIHGPDALWNMVRALEENPDKLVATAAVMKHTAYQRERSFVDRLSLAASENVQRSRESTSGCLSCIRSGIARDLVMPTGMMGTDHFLNHMILSRGFRTRDFLRPFVRASDAVAVFRTYTSLKGVLHHQRRRMIASTMNWLLFPHLYRMGEQQDVAEYIRRMNRLDPGWVSDLLRRTASRRGWWVLPRSSFPNRFRWVVDARGLRRVRAAVIAVLATGVDLLSAVRANLAFHRRDRFLTRYW